MPASPPSSHDVLVVEDDAELRRLLQQALEEDGLTVVAAANGVEALEVLGRTRVALVVTDLRMPVMDGQRLVETMRATPSLAHIAVLIVTAVTDPGSIPRGRRCSSSPCGWRTSSGWRRASSS